VLPAESGAGRQAELVFAKPPSHTAMAAFDKVVRLNLLAGRDPQVIERVLEGPEIVVQATSVNREFPVGGPTVNSFLPLIVAFLLGALVLTVSTTLMEALVVEKENRVIEVMVTSVSPGQMMAGKILGILAMGLLLLLSWFGMLVVAVWLGGSVLDVSWMQEIQPSWRDLGLLVLVTLPAMLFASALMVLVGTTLVDNEESQQAGALVALAFLLPIYLFFLFANSPNSAGSLAVSLFPMTAVTSLAMRSIFVEVPVWQYAAAAGIALLGGVALIWLAGKALRVNMLRYGQRLRLGELLRGEGGAR
jgi:ABC-2 type transport system permease protein